MNLPTGATRICSIVLEGLNGCGKTTAIVDAQALIEAAGHRTVVFHDPNLDLPIGNRVKQVWSGSLYDEEEAMHLLFAASSLEGQLHAYKAARDLGATAVISDRSPLSTFAYLTSLEMPRFIDLHRSYTWPDAIIYLEASVETRARRLAQRDSPVTRTRAPEKAIVARYEQAFRYFADCGTRVEKIDAEDSVIVATAICDIALSIAMSAGSRS